MPVEVDNLMQNLHGHFLRLYHQDRTQARGPATTDPATTDPPTTRPAIVLAFEPIGQSVSPNEFKINRDDAGFSPALAVERVSEIVNQVPLIDGDSFAETGRHIDEFYGMVLDQSFPSSTDKTAVEQFAILKSRANKLFDTTLGSLRKGASFRFHPSYATPDTWFDPNEASNWTSYSFVVDLARPEAAAGASPGPPTRDVAWKLAPSKAAVASAINSNPALLARANAFFASQAGTGSAAGSDHAAARIGQLIAASKVLAVRPSSAARPAPRMGQAPRKSPAGRVEVRDHRGRAGNTPISATRVPSLVGRKINLADRLTFQRAVGTVAPSKEVQSDKFALSFKYCLVGVDRPWLYQPLLYDRSWYIPSRKSGELSTGEAKNNAGLLPYLPVGFITVKDLEITAKWTPEDAKLAQSSIALGPFSLQGSSLNASVLSRKEVQILAWICEVLPLLPPNPDKSS